MEGLRRGMEKIIPKRSFDVGSEGSSGLIEYLEELPSGETPLLCGYAKLLREKIFVVKKNSIDEYEPGRIVCPKYAKDSEGLEIKCQGLSDLFITKEGCGVYGYCGVVGRMLFIKKDSEPIHAFEG